jgi:isocitrate/methylisocitrate lyase
MTFDKRSAEHDTPRARTAREIENSWTQDARWKGISRHYSAEDVSRMRGSVHIEHTLARRGAARLWHALHARPPVRALGALTGHQAVQQVAAGLEAIYCSGWQVAGDANTAGQTYPDQSLYPVDSVPALVRRINRAFERADQIAHLAHGNGAGPQPDGAGPRGVDWFAPIVADAEAGFGGDLNAFELMKALVEAGTAGVHFEDQLASAKKCGHMGGKVLVPTREFVQKLQAARLAADLLDVPAVLIARTDANSAKLLTSDIDPRDRAFLTGVRTPEGFFELKGGLDAAIARGLAYAPYADLLWCETSHADLDEARRFAAAIHSRFPGKLLAYNCSPSFNWSGTLDAATIARFQDALGEMGYAFQFVTLAGFHSLNFGMFELAREYRERGMTAYARLQDKEFEVQGAHGYAAVKHQSFVGTGWFDELAKVISHGETSTAALTDSTEAEQF